MQDARETRPLRILNGLNGKLRPGRLTLLLGPPSCGKSTFMRALTGRLMPAQGKVGPGPRDWGYHKSIIGVGHGCACRRLCCRHRERRLGVRLNGGGWCDGLVGETGHRSAHRPPDAGAVQGVQLMTSNVASATRALRGGSICRLVYDQKVGAVRRCVCGTRAARRTCAFHTCRSVTPMSLSVPALPFSFPSLQVSGEITYNGHPIDEFNVQRTAAYVDQVSSCRPPLVHVSYATTT